MLAERADAIGELDVVRHERPGVARGAEVLRRVEAERSGEALRAGAQPVPLSAVSLARVLEEVKTVAHRHQPEGAHVGHLPVEVHGKHEPGPRGHRRIGGLGIHVVVPLRGVDDDRHAAGLRHGLEGRDERLGRDDDLVAVLEPACDQRQPECVEPARRADASRRLAVRRERRLELGDVRPVDEAAAVDERRDLGDHVLLEPVHHRCPVEERNGAGAVGQERRHRLSRLGAIRRGHS